VVEHNYVYLQTATCFDRSRPSSGHQHDILKYDKVQYICIDRYGFTVWDPTS